MFIVFKADEANSFARPKSEACTISLILVSVFMIIGNLKPFIFVEKTELCVFPNWPLASYQVSGANWNDNEILPSSSEDVLLIETIWELEDKL